jgi:endonuclease/exonuclease/phosphatase family metal-dependent hydrolase
MNRLLCVLLALLCWGAAEAGPPLVLATYNLRLNLASDGPNAWPQRRDRVRELIRYHEWDIFGTQEALPEQIDDLDQRPEYAHVGVGRDDGARAGEHSAIYYRRERFEALRHGTFWLSPTPETPSMGWDARCCKRIATWAEFKDKLAPQAPSFFVFNTHFDHEGVVARRESAQLLLARARAAVGDFSGKRPLLVIGDFNATPADEPIRILAAALRDARASSQTPPYGPDGTFNGFQIDAPMHDRIDHIFHTPGITVLKYGVLSDSRDGRFPSDHHPVVVRLSLP